MNIFEWVDGMSVTASDMNDMQDILNDNIKTAIANQIVLTSGGDRAATGRIIDGQKEYVKRINLGNLPNATTKDIDLGFNISTLIKIEGSAYRATDGTHVPLPFTTLTLNNQIGVWIEGRSTLRVMTGSNRTGFIGYVNIYFTVEE